ncbi:MAG: response regulator [Pseudomonadales bacterium]|nr:response regulator [Pseudomonadales bacterium]
MPDKPNTEGDSFLNQLDSESTLAELPLHSIVIEPKTRTKSIADDFLENPELPGVIVSAGDVLHGVLPREWFFQQISKPLALDVYMNRSVSLLLATMKNKPLELDSMLGVQEASHLALLRPSESFNELIVVRFENGERKILSIQDLLRAQAKLLEIANTKILEQKNFADSANHAKSLFLANMSHEIRTPLNGIIGMTRLVLDTELSQEQREYLDMVRHSADSLVNVINDVLDFSKVEAGKLVIESIPIRIREMMAESIKPLAFRAHGKDIELNYRVAPNVPNLVQGDPTRIHQILTNLIGNAIKFTHEGEISVNIDCLEMHEDKMQLQFSVRDTGIGIPKDRIDSVFDAFEQVDGSTTREFGGTGLGLSISAKLVELLGGEIWVESELNQGTIFTFTCELTCADEETQSEEAIKFTERLLVIEDNLSSRATLVELLDHCGAKVDEVANAGSALEKLYSESQAKDYYAAIIVDCTLADMNIKEFIKSVRQKYTSEELKIILCSPSDSIPMYKSVKGIDALLAKPLSEKALLTALANVLQKSESIPHDKKTLNDLLQNSTGQLKILLAEDNIVNQKLAMHLLQKSGHDTTVVSDGQAALSEYIEKEFDLVLMDIQMPVMDGWQATESIRRLENESGKHTPIIALTAHAISGDREKCLNAGMDGYLPKPFKFDAFTSEIDRVMTSARSRH